MAVQTAYQSFENAEGITKKLYDAGIKHLASSHAKIFPGLMESMEAGSRAVGDTYQISMVVVPPNGVTFAGANSASSSSRSALPTTGAMVIKQASVQPYEIDFLQEVQWVTLARAQAAGDAAVASHFATVIKAMRVAGGNYLEVGTLLGQQSIGTVESTADLGGNLCTITITEATWRPGLFWALQKGAPIDSFTSTTKNNASGALVLQSITSATRTITTTYTGTHGSEIAAGDVLVLTGSWDGTTYTQMPGLIAQASNITGTSLGLSASTYPGWAGNTYAAGGVISYDILEAALALVRDRGAEGKLRVVASNAGAGKLMDELKARNVFPKQGGEGKIGYSSLTYETLDFGELEIMNHGFMRYSEALIYPVDETIMIGSTPLTNEVPTGPNATKLVWQDNSNNTVKMGMWADLAVAIKNPAASCLITGITQS